MSNGDSKGLAFAKGAVGCLAAFLILGVVALAFGGTVYMDLGGFILLIVIGGVIGLVVNAIYQRGKRDASLSDDGPPASPDRLPPGD